MIFGFKLHMLITLGGLIIDFELAPASKLDLAVGRELLSGHENRIVIGDKAYVSAPAAETSGITIASACSPNGAKTRKNNTPNTSAASMTRSAK